MRSKPLIELHRQLGVFLARADVPNDVPVVVDAGDHQYRYATVYLTSVQRKKFPNADPFCDAGCHDGPELRALLIE